MIRRLCIEEENGIYRVRRGDRVLAAARTIEGALKGATTAPDQVTYPAAELLEGLLGEKPEASKIAHTGNV